MFFHLHRIIIYENKKNLFLRMNIVCLLKKNEVSEVVQELCCQTH